MAIALEADFRSITTPQAGELPERQQMKSSGGEAFASSLARARDADSAEPADASPDTSATAAALPFLLPVTEPTITPQAKATNAADGQPLGSDAAAAILKSEIIVDRQIVREGVKEQAEGTADQEARTDIVAAHAPAALASVSIIQAASDPSATADNANGPATQETGRIAAQAAAQPSQSADPNRAPTAALVPAPDEVAAISTTISAVAGGSPATATTNAKSPANRQTGQTDVPANPDAFALMAPKGEAAAPFDVRLSDTRIAPLTDITGKGNPVDTASLNSATASGTQNLAAVAAPATPQAPAAAASLLPSAPAFAVVTASPAQIVDIVSVSADDGQSDRVVVQLDPPELGRVSIDFKFDAQGLQHVTITSETPEAMRQLRQMHSELVQSLERHGIGSENLSFEHQQQGPPQSPPPNPFARTAALGGAGVSDAAITASTESTIGPRTPPGGRLDIRL